MKINIIGDIAGRYDELQELLKKMPEADIILSVGDMIDRGPKSNQVIEWFMTNPKARAVYGNHEEMMVESVRQGTNHSWLWNGGHSTVESYKDADGNVDIPAEHIEWLEKLPMYFETDDLIVSHAPITSLKNIPTDPYSRDHYFIWSRYEPSKPQDKFMIYGHNGKYKEHKWGDGSVFAICIDNSHRDELRGIHWPTREVFTQEYFKDALVSQLEEDSDSKSDS